jgi:protein-tyrosine-phosphatase
MVERPLHALILCTGNSARSILAEALLGRLGAGRVVAHSAGSRPRGSIHPGAAALLASEGYDPAAFRSKSWDEFARPGAPLMDLVITVCDAAAGESCPLWPGTPLKAHWGLPDPAAVADPEAQRAAFRACYAALESRVRALLALAPEQLRSRAALERIHADGG